MRMIIHVTFLIEKMKNKLMAMTKPGLFSRTVTKKENKIQSQDLETGSLTGPKTKVQETRIKHLDLLKLLTMTIMMMKMHL